MGKKILYIRLDSSPLPEAGDEIIVKDFNLENYFCTLLGRKLLEDAGLAGTILYPGKLVTDFEKVDGEAYKEIIQQWRYFLINLLNAIHVQNRKYEINLPFSYVYWLRDNYNAIYKDLSFNHINELVIHFSKEVVYKEIIESVLLKKIHFLLTKIGDRLQRIIFSVDVFIENSIFLKGINKCADYQILEKIRIGFFPYEGCYSYSEGLAAVKKNGKWGFIDKKKTEIIPNIYDMVDNFSEGLAAIYKKGKWGYIDKEGNEIIPCIYDKARIFHNGLAMVRKDERYNVIDKHGNEIVPKTYTLTFHVAHLAISEGLIAVQNVNNHKHGFIDGKGKEIIPCIYSSVDGYSEGLTAVGVIKEEVSIKNENALDIFDKFMDLFNEECYGFVDKYGNEVIPCIYDEAYAFSEGLAMVRKNGKYGFIDKDGNEVIPCIYDSACGFSNGMAKVKKEGKYGFINNRGDQIIPCIYEKDSIGDPVVGELIWVKKNGKYGFINKDGKEIIPFIYDHTSYFSEEWAYFFVIRNSIKKRGLVNAKGEELIFINCLANCCEGMISIGEGEYLSENYRYNFIPAELLEDL